MGPGGYQNKETLNNIIVNRCVIIIANKLKTLKNSNKIYVLQNGQIVQYGKHDQLIKNKESHYYKLTQGMTWITIPIWSEILIKIIDFYR